MMQARVKSVLSGDTVVLQHLTRDVQKQLTFAGVNAPRISRKDQNTPDEACAFEAREFLRRKLVGKVVNFRVDYTNPSSKRDFGVLMVDSENVVLSLVAAGLARVKENEKNNNKNQDYVDDLLAAETRAKAAHVGIWQSSEALARTVRAIKYDPPAKATFESYKKKPYNAIVEHVINGSSIRILVLPGYEYITVNLTGIQCPSAREGREEEYALEAKQYTESNLLQRDIQILFEGIDKYDNFLATIMMASGKTFQEELLLQGLASVQDWSVSKTKYASQIRVAEGTAKTRRIRKWKNYEAPKSSLDIPSATPSATASSSSSAAASTAIKRDFSGKVIEIISGDTLTVKDEKGIERKLSISSIKCPRLGAREKAAEPWAVEARELVRQKLAGKKVSVHVDYKSELKFKTGDADNTEERYAASIFYDSGKKNIALDLLQIGYASVIFHKAGQEKSAHYDKLKIAFDEAVAAGRGIHGNKNNAPVHHITDLSFESSGKVNNYFRILQPKGKIRAVIEKVFSASRYKIYLPREYLMLNFAVTNIVTPALARRNNPSASTGASSSEASSSAADESAPTPVANVDEPFAKQAIDFVREALLNREVTVEFEKVDKFGAVLGTLTVGNSTNFVVTLLEEGLAKLQTGAERAKNYVELKEAQDKAEKAKKRIWSVEGAPIGIRRAPRRLRKARPEDTSRLIPAADGEYLKVRVTDVISPTRFFVQTNDAADTLGELEAKIAELNLDETPAAAAYKPRKNEICFAKFSADNRWYRAKVFEVREKDNVAAVEFIDFGNQDEVQLSDVRPYSDSVPKSEALASEFQLAFVHEDDSEEPDEEVLVEALDTFKSFCWDKDLVAKVEYRDGNGKTFVTLLDVAGEGSSGASANSTLVRNGLLFVKHNVKEQNVEAFGRAVDSLVAQENKAKAEHLALWQYGVPMGEDDY